MVSAGPIGTKLQGAIIAAGSGARLRKSTRADLPKPLVELEGETMLARQARALMAAGAASIVAVINSETARLADEMKLANPRGVKLVVRDTDNSMETMLALGEFLEPGWFLAATVDAVIPQTELTRFVNESRRKIELCNDKNLAGVLALTRWRGDARALFADVTEDGLIARLGGAETRTVTAGLYFLSTRVFDFADEARRTGLDALRRFLAMLIEHRTHLGAIEIDGAIDVDEAPDLDAARRALRSNQ
jgi:choline kinase